MELYEALELLREDSLLSGMPAAIAKEIEEHATVRRVAAGTAIARQGEPANRLVIALTTPLRLSIVAGDGTAQSVGQLGARRTLNLGAVLNSSVWEYTAEAENDGFVLETDAARFLGVLPLAPAYAQYLELMTTRRSIRELARVLRAASVRPETMQRMLAELVERRFGVGEIVMAADPLEARWVLIDEGHCELAIQRGGTRIELGTLDVGDFYGGSTILMRMRAVELRGIGEGNTFQLDADSLRELAKSDPALRTALGREKPELVRRVRRALIEVGAEFTKALAGPIDLPAIIDVSGDAGTGAAAEVAGPIGAPWAPSGAKARLLEGPRVVVEEDTGAAAVCALLQAHGRTSTVSDVRKRLRRQPPSLLDLATLIEREGLSTHAAKVSKPALLARLDLPLLMVLGKRFVVLHKISGAWFHFFDPISGLRRMKLGAIRPLFAGSVLTARDVRSFLQDALPSDKDKESAAPVNRRSRAWSQRLRFLRLLGDSRGVLIGTGFVSLMLLLLGIVAPRLSGVIVDQVLVHSDNALLVVITVGMVLVNGAQVLLSGAKEICVAYLSGLLDYRLSSLIYRHTLGVDVSSHGRDRVGATLSRMQELQRVRESIASDFIDLVLQIAQGLVYAIMVMWYSWKLGMIAVAVAPIAYAVVRIGGARFRILYAKAFDQNTRAQSETTEQIESIATIKAVSGAQQARTRWENTMVEGVELQRGMLHTSAAISTALQTVQEIARYVGLYVAVRMVIARELSPGEVIAVIQYLVGALRPVFVLAGKLDELEQLGISFEKLDDVLQLPLEDDEQAGAREPEIEGNIVVRGLGYRYTEDGPAILDDVSFEARRGQTIAIVGRSGSGKTTLARLLQGAMRPTAGEILFDEADSRELGLTAIRRHVGIVMQDSQLFAGSIRDNIAFGDDRPDELRVRESARLAAAHDFISRFPNGYQTFLAEGGLGLSGGQRQRVNLARALYRNPRILILDETTSALDAESERAIMQNMREILRNRTAIVIAHRLHTVKNADLILVIDQGRVVETGKHADLIGRRGLYHALFAQQFNQA